MPEGHVTHALARDLRRTLGAEPVRATSPQGRFADGAALVDGRRLVRTDAWGKYLFLHFDHGQVVHIHLGLIGKLRPVDPATPPTESVRLRLHTPSHAWQLTGPTRCEVVTRQQVKEICAPLGADPLRRSPDVARMRERMGRRRAPLGAVLLDQSVIAGIGNVYRAELLFLRGIHPMRLASTLTDEEVTDLWDETVLQLRRGLRLGRIVTRSPAEVGRSLLRLEPEERLYVYHRDTCRWCGAELQTLQLAGRPIQYCPVHQPP